MSRLGLEFLVKNFDFEIVDSARKEILAECPVCVENLNKMDENFEKYEDPELLNEFVLRVASRKKVTMVRNFGFQISCDRLHYGCCFLLLSNLGCQKTHSE